MILAASQPHISCTPAAVNALTPTGRAHVDYQRTRVYIDDALHLALTIRLCVCVCVRILSLAWALRTRSPVSGQSDGRWR